MIDWNDLVAQKLVAPHAGQTRLIYGLVDPRTLLIRYVGSSTTGLSRPNAHRTPREQRRPSYKTSWVKSLLDAGLDYTVVVLEVRPVDLHASERFWIAYGRACGWPLTNLTAGGEGALGRVASKETRAKLSASLRGKPRSPEAAKASADGHRGKPLKPEHLAKLRGRKQAPEHVAKRAAARRGRACAPETKAKIAAALTGKTHTPEARAKVSASLIGNKRAARKP